MSNRINVIEYIESTGTQYIDTGFKPNQDTRVVMDFRNSGDYSSMTTGLCPLFGARNASSSAVFALWIGETSYPHYGNVAYNKNGSFTTNLNTRLIFDFNKNVVSIGGNSITCEGATFTTNHNLCVLTINNYGSIENRRASGKLYSCQIYDNGTLVRDYVPCKDPDGVVCLYDKVEGKYYYNAGTGEFTGKPFTKSVLFTRRGKPPAMGKKASDYAVGESVFLNVNGSPTEFLVVHQGNPNTSLYDASCDGVWLLMKDIYTTKKWDSVSNDYPNSDAHSWLNGDFLGLFDEKTQSIIKQVKIPYVNGTGNSGTVKSGADGLSTKAFLLSVRETGYSGTTNNYQTKVDGSSLAYFDGATSDKRIAYYNGTATIWWLRSPYTANTTYVICGQTSGGLNGYGCTNTYGFRPALILPFDAKFNPDTNIIK